MINFAEVLGGLRCVTGGFFMPYLLTNRQNPFIMQLSFMLDWRCMMKKLGLKVFHRDAFNRKRGILREEVNKKTPVDDQQQISKGLVNLNNMFDTNKAYVYRGQKVYFDMAFSVFSKYIRKHLLLIGTQGMGREAIIYGIAERIKKGNCPDEFKDYSVYEMNLRTFFVGVSQEGDVQSRLDELTETLKSLKKVILFIKPFEKVFELNMLVELGKWMEIPEVILHLIRPMTF